MAITRTQLALGVLGLWMIASTCSADERADYNRGMTYLTGQGVPADSAKAVQYFRKSADAGFARAQYMLAQCYAAGIGVRVDLEQSNAWHRKAAASGLPPEWVIPPPAPPPAPRWIRLLSQLPRAFVGIVTISLIIGVGALITRLRGTN